MRSSKKIGIYFTRVVEMDGSIIIPEFIFEDKDLNYAQMILFGLILKLADKKEKKCYTSYEELGKLLNSDNRTIRRNLDLLVGKGYLQFAFDKNVKKGQKCQNGNDSGELIKNRKIIIFGQKCHSYIYSIHSYTITSSKKEEMLEAFRKDTRLTPYMEEEYVCKRWDFKEEMKQPYKDVSSFMTMLVKMKNKIAKSGGMPKSDRNRRNRFAFMVDTAIEKKREGLNWYDSMEQDYLDSKDDLYPNPKQNE